MKILVNVTSKINFYDNSEESVTLKTHFVNGQIVKVLGFQSQEAKLRLMCRYLYINQKKKKFTNILLLKFKDIIVVESLRFYNK